MGEHITANEDGTFTVHVHGPVADKMIALLAENADLREALTKSASREAALMAALKLSEAVLAATQEVYGACLGPKTHEGINAALAKIKEAS